jgi:ATP-dependent DNA helicase RecQ
MSNPERNETYDQLHARQLKLLYVSPERLLMQGFLDFLKGRGISSVAIDENL